MKCSDSSTQPKKEKQTFLEWVREKEIFIIVIGVLLFVAVEKFAKFLHNDLVSPCWKNVMSRGGLPYTQSHPWYYKLLLNVLELSFCIIALYFISQYIFQHSSNSKKDEKDKKE